MKIPEFGKGFFKTKPTQEEDGEVQSDENLLASISEDDENTSYETFGFQRASAHLGSIFGLKICLNRIFQDYKEKIRKDKIKQEEFKKPYIVKREDYKGNNERLEKSKEKIENEDIPLAKKKLENLNNELKDIRQNPEKYTGDKAGRAGFIIGIIILIFLSLYLFVFYSSASYSAFFKEFVFTDLGVAKSIFDPRAISKSFQDGVTELILILTIPFVFIGLGFLVHKFLEAKSFIKYLKVSAVLLVTFVFDAILAYEITSKIYNMRMENSFQDMPPYSPELALSSVNFWLIIFAGFVVYLIWGFVFDFIMEAYDKLTKATLIETAKKDEIKESEEIIKDLDTQIVKISSTISNNNTEINKLTEILNHTIFRPQEFEGIIHQFNDGWFHWMKANKKNDETVKEAHIIVEHFVTINISNVEFIKIAEN